MKISAHEEYGLRCLVQLARAEMDGESLTLNQIAEREGLSVANAGKLMWVLNKARLVQSQRGTKGGYTLARPANDIRLNEVIRILDEDTADRFCETHAGSWLGVRPRSARNCTRFESCNNSQGPCDQRIEELRVQASACLQRDEQPKG